MDPNPVGREVRWSRWIPALGVVALVLALTLVPVDDPSAPELSACLVCGTHWLADLLSNIPFFVPLGLALAWGGMAFVPTVVTGLALSVGIEGAQLFIPGRFSSVADILANSLGTGFGHLLFRGTPVLLLLRGRPRKVAAALTMALGSLALLAPAILHRPALSGDPYYPQWAPRLKHLEPWEGIVQGVVADDLPLPHAGVEVTPALRRKLQQGTVLRVDGTGAPPPSRLSAVFAIHDHAQREVALVGQRGHDLVWRLRRNASRMALQPPSIVWTGVLEGTEGNPIRLGIHTSQDGRACLVVNEQERCGLEPSTGRGWALLIPGEFFPPSWPPLMDLVWLAGLAFVPGLWAGALALAPLAALAGAAALTPALGPLSPLPAVGWGALLLGGILGVLCGRLALGRGEGPPPSP